MRTSIPDPMPLTASVQLVLCCARTKLPPGQAERIHKLLRDGVNWEFVFRFAIRHGVAPLLFMHLQSFSGDQIPPAVVSRLRRYSLNNARRNLSLTAELFRLLDRLSSCSIPVLPVKGSVLAAAVYGNLALRPFVDIDLLVRRKDLWRAQELICSMGYQPYPQLKPSWENEYARSQRELVLVGKKSRHIVELNWTVAPRFFSFFLPASDLWRRAQQALLLDRRVRTLSFEDLFLTLCVHGTWHLWQRLSWICDLAETISSSEDVNWPQVIHRARHLGALRMITVGVYLCRDLLDTQVPDALGQGLPPDTTAKTLVLKVKQMLFRIEGRSGFLKELLFHLRARERWQDRIRYCLDLFLTPTHSDWTFVSLPWPLHFLYYLIRPIRITCEAFASLIETCTRDSRGS